MSTLSTTVRRGLVVTAAAVAAGPVVGGNVWAATGPAASSPLGGLPLTGGLAKSLPVGGLTQDLPLADGLGNLSGGLSNLGTVPVAGPTLSGLTTNIAPMNGMLGLAPKPATTLPATDAVPAWAQAPGTMPAAAPVPGVAPGAVSAVAPTVTGAAATSAHPATRSRTGATVPLATSVPGPALSGPKLLAGMPLVDTPLGPGAPSIAQLPQYAAVKDVQKIQDIEPTLAAAQAANLAAPADPNLPLLGHLSTNPLTQNLPLTGALGHGLPTLNGLGGVSGLLGHF